MNKREVAKLEHGIYLLFWKSGGRSLAAVGSDRFGNRWMAPINWIGIGSGKNWRMVDYVAILHSVEGMKSE